MVMFFGKPCRNSGRAGVGRGWGVCNHFKVLYLLLYCSESPSPTPVQENESLAVQPPPSLAKKSKELTGRSVPEL